jgi:hypothetical protein
MTKKTETLGRQTKRDSARIARLEAVAKAQRRSARRRIAVIVGASVTAVALAGGTSWAVVGSGDSGSSTQKKVALTGMQTYSGLARDHVDGPVSYPQTPPVGGAHSSTWQNCGVYYTPVHSENAVHSLEHGAMWITYRPGLAAPELATLLKDVSGQPYALVSPYPGLPAPIVASAWGAQLKLSSASDPRLKAFVDAFKSGTQAPEPGGECTGGTGTPQG